MKLYSTYGDSSYQLIMGVVMLWVHVRSKFTSRFDYNVGYFK